MLRVVGSLLPPRSAPTTLLGRNGYLTPLGQGFVETGGSPNAATCWPVVDPLAARQMSGWLRFCRIRWAAAADDRVYRRLIELLP
jgi:hypothetical protein